jgi:hypothetical protein
MTRDKFEQLLSDWLDGRDPNVADQLDAAIAASPDFARLRDQWLEFESGLRRNLPVMRAVAWDRVRGRIAAAVADES